MSFCPIVQKLVDYLDSDPSIKQAFADSFALAYSTGLEEFKEYNIHNVDDYLRYMDAYVNWVPSENRTGTNIYNHLCIFYFILDCPPVRDQQDPIDPATRSPHRYMSEWLIEYAKIMGSWMDTPESITPESLQTFYSSPIYRMQDYPVPPGGWKTFNEFFARHINPNLRPIASPTDDTVIVSPADCAFDGSWPVDDQATVTTFPVKGVPWTIAQLLADDASGTDYGPKFAGGVFTHSFLNTTDYHRQHAPVSGTVVEAKVIPGLVYLEVVLKADTTRSSGTRIGMHRYIRHRHDKHLPHGDRPLPIENRNSLDAPDSPGYQFLQARGLILIDNPVLGLVAVLPMGMAQVSSVVLSVKEGDVVTKGQEISYFQFGGSDIVMVFQKDAKVQFEQEIGVHYNFGQQVAVGTGKQ